MHKIIVENESINLDNTNELYIAEGKSLSIYLFGSGKVCISLSKDSKLVVYHVGVDITNDIVINLDGENSEVVYNYDVLNFKDNSMTMTINHNKDNTISNVYNHGVNVEQNKLHFELNGVVPKSRKSCICNQENRIINISDGSSTICPNLLIDSYDVVSSHAAYIGKFSDDILFYLMSRGISKKNAYSLLIMSLLLPDGIDREKVDNFIMRLSEI